MKYKQNTSIYLLQRKVSLSTLQSKAAKRRQNKKSNKPPKKKKPEEVGFQGFQKYLSNPKEILWL